METVTEWNNTLLLNETMQFTLLYKYRRVNYNLQHRNKMGAKHMCHTTPTGCVVQCSTCYSLNNEGAVVWWFDHLWPNEGISITGEDVKHVPHLTHMEITASSVHRSASLERWPHLASFVGALPQARCSVAVRYLQTSLHQLRLAKCNGHRESPSIC